MKPHNGGCSPRQTLLFKKLWISPKAWRPQIKTQSHLRRQILRCIKYLQVPLTSCVTDVGDPSILPIPANFCMQPVTNVVRWGTLLRCARLRPQTHQRELPVTVSRPDTRRRSQDARTGWVQKSPPSRPRLTRHPQKPQVCLSTLSQPVEGNLSWWSSW